MNSIICILSMLVSSCLIGQEFTYYEHLNSISVGNIIHGDLNGDGEIDFITDSDFSWRSYIAISNDDQIEFEVFNEGVILRNLVIFDVDMDGDNDIIASDITETNTLFFINDGTANFEKMETGLPHYQGIDLNDVDDDGNIDLILSQDMKIRVFNLNDLSLKFEFSDDSSIFGFQPSFIKSLDYNSDGLNDFIVLHNKSMIFIFTQTDKQEYDKSEISESFVGADEFHLTDINGDGLVDFLVNSFEPSVLFNQGNDEYEKKVIPLLDGAFSWLNVSDFNNDNKDEILVAEGQFLSEVISSIEYDSIADMFITSNLTNSYANTRKGEVADIDGDGLEDFYFYSRSPSGKLVLAVQGLDMLEDNDSDGFTSDVDCDDNNPNVNPEAEEICDNIDNNCDGQIDENQTFLSWWIDSDNDGFGEGPMESRIVDCKQPQGYVQNYDDCDDSNPNINPNAQEIPDNGIDEDCDGMDLITDVHELSDVILKIYPNPANEWLKIDIQGNLDYKVTLYDLSGKILKVAYNQDKIDLNNIANGVYILELTDRNNSNRVLERVVIQN